MRLLRAGAALFILAALLLGAVPVYADTADPDSTPTVEFNAYRNSGEPGDWLLLIYANIPYATPPSTPVTETFLWSFMDTDNTTQLGGTLGTNYNDDGYGYNVYSMYWSAAEVTALGMVWNTVYTIRLSGNPSVFDTPPVYNYPLNVVDYSTQTAQADVQAELAERIFFIAGDLENKWGLLPGYELLTQSETTTVLSIYGEAFFRGAIFGLQALCPSVFSSVIRTLDIDPRDWDPEYAENVTGQWAGTWVETSQEAGMALFNTSYDLLSVIIVLVLAFGLLIGNLMLTGDHWNALCDVLAWGVIAARLALYDFAFLILIAALAWIYISAKVWHRLFQ